MPSERTFKVYFAFFAYGGNGGIANVSPYLLKWWGQLTMALAADPRIGKENFVSEIISDTPITMTRNKAVNTAKKWGADVLVMLDSDNVPDLNLAYDPTARPFFESSFDYLVKYWDQGPHVICAPYCGPPPHPVLGGEENVYVFEWKGFASDDADGAFSLSSYSREQAVQMKGIQSCAAAPTGVIMYDMRAFDLISTPYFDYEWNKDHSEKASTEDVYNTRNISLAGCSTLGYNPLLCNWDAWAGHAKTKIVSPPKMLYTEQVAETYKKAVRDDLSVHKRIVDVDIPLPPLRSKKQVKSDKPAGIQRVIADGELELGDHLTSDEAALWSTYDDMGVTMMPWDKEAIRNLVEATAQRRRFVRIVEVGTWIGSTAKFMHEILTELDVPHRIDCVDTFQGTPSDHTSDIAKAVGGSTHQKFIENVGELRGEFIFEHVGASTDIALDWQDKADLIFLDADHTYEGCKADIEAWRPHLKASGMLSGHDYGIPGITGVTEAVDELLGDPCVMSAHRIGPDSRSTVWAAVFKPKHTSVYESKSIDCVPNLQPV